MWNKQYKNFVENRVMFQQTTVLIKKHGEEMDKSN